MNQKTGKACIVTMKRVVDKHMGRRYEEVRHGTLAASFGSLPETSEKTIGRNSLGSWNFIPSSLSQPPVLSSSYMNSC